MHHWQIWQYSGFTWYVYWCSGVSLIPFIYFDLPTENHHPHSCSLLLSRVGWWVLTGVLREESAALAVDNLLNDRNIWRNRWRWDQADASHHWVYWCNKAQTRVKSRDTQWVCRRDSRTTKNNTDYVRSTGWSYFTPFDSTKAILNQLCFLNILPIFCKKSLVHRNFWIICHIFYLELAPVK